jgi:hypothetical protein
MPSRSPEPPGGPRSPAHDPLAQLADRFWRWRAGQQPRSADDIPRIERPAGWVPDWSEQAVRRYRAQLAGYRVMCRALADGQAPVPVQVNHRLLACATDRVHWELNVLRSWRSDPSFYLDQSIGVLFDLLLVPPPFDADRAWAIVRQLGAVPEILRQGEQNLAGSAIAELARRAVERSASADEQLRAAMSLLTPYLPAGPRAELAELADRAARALTAFRGFLARRLRSFTRPVPLAAGELAFLLHRVALLPFTPDQLRDLGRREFSRAVALETQVRQRNHALPRPALPATLAELIDRHRRDERHARQFYAANGLLDLPGWLARYRTLPMPPYLAPLAWLGITDDLTSASRLSEDATRYLSAPDADLPYFDLANAVDPRLGIAHEGAHHHQLALSWANDDPARRHFYDSTPNEGIAFYNEELLLTTGFFDDQPVAREYVLNFMRLRALRVGVDIGLATGELSIPDAARTLQRYTPMDRATALAEASFFAAVPGQGMSYQVGKSQVQELLADAVVRDGTGFDLAAFHGYLWRNGNVPLALLRWEYLHDRGALDRADRLAAACPIA